MTKELGLLIRIMEYNAHSKKQVKKKNETGNTDRNDWTVVETQWKNDWKL